jgi:hypothetical protein
MPSNYQKLTAIQHLTGVRPDSLRTLMWVLTNCPEAAQLDWSDLPTFGGNEPSDTVGIWSWDKNSVLVGTCAGDLSLEAR